MKINCETCDKVEAQITYRIRNTEWSECFACLKVAITDKESARLMLQGVDDTTE
jgi:protein-arginine kinase activator protein McsA